MAKNENSSTKAKILSIKYFTLPESLWDSYEGKCLRNNALFEIGLITTKNKKPDRFMVYQVIRELNKKEQTRYYLAEHIQKDIESTGGYSRYTMECKPLYEVDLVKKTKSSPYAIYKAKENTRKTPSRKIKPSGSLITKILL